MGGFDDHVRTDWMPPSPSPRSLFAAMLGNDDVTARSDTEPLKYDQSNDGGFTFPGPNRQIGAENGDGNQRGQIGQLSNSGENSEKNTSLRGGLVERRAARAGHSVPRLNTDIMKPADDLKSQQSQSPYLTIPPGLSPTSFLDSPVFLSNSLAQPSPTTGKFQLALNGNGNGIGNNNGNGNVNGRSLLMLSDSANKSKDNLFEEPNNASFAFKPFPDSAPLLRHHVNPPFMSAQSFQANQALVQSDKKFPPQKIEQVQNFSDFTLASIENKNFSLLNGNLERSQQNLEVRHDNDVDQRTNGDITSANGASSDDGYNWRKYGQKQVKGSEYPRSYYKCTQPNCPVKKKVERSHEGHITEIIYKGGHNHPKLGPNRRSGIGSSGEVNEQGGTGVDGGSVWGTDMQQNGNGSSQWVQESNIEVTSSGIVMQGSNGGQFESSDAVDGSTTFTNDDEEDDRATHGSVSLGYDNEGDETESKRRKVEAYAADVSGATRAIREPRVVVQTTSEVDILDDGYRWRKYGQKVVKGNPNPRSYYKCTSTGCSVRKHVERASHDLKSVITTYEGKHNHEVPAARNSSHVNNNNNMATAQQVHMAAESSRMQNNMARFERSPYGLSGGQQMGPVPTHGYGYSMSHQGQGGLAHMAAMANQGKLSVFPSHHYLNHQQPRQMNEMGLMVPKGEPKVEPMSEAGLNLVGNGGAPIYHQMVNHRLP
ncbi:probable WRKY transcription factor 2 [Rutidosis leptorrhynchoides]|uniref:probable WRKY transcription factor 2 n=1 Tax=Rutidosis leptorrhynchoides TaxID=125765 RepID=UPI003A994F5F